MLCSKQIAFGSNRALDHHGYSTVRLPIALFCHSRKLSFANPSPRPLGRPSFRTIRKWRISGAPIRIADIADSEPARQLAALISVIRRRTGIAEQRTLLLYGLDGMVWDEAAVHIWYVERWFFSEADVKRSHDLYILVFTICWKLVL